MADWKKIQKEYISGASQRFLAKKYHVGTKTISDKAKKGGWDFARQQAEVKTTAMVVDAVVSDAAMMYEFGRSLMAKAIEGLKLCDPDNVNALKGYAQIGRDAKDILNVRSEADLKEQEARILKLRAEAEERKREQEGGVKLVIEGLPEEYAR